MSGDNIKWIVPWLTGALWFCITTVLVIQAKSIIENDRRSVERHLKILEELKSMDSRISRIEASNFTSQDAQAMMQMLLEKLPPPWLVESVRENRKSIEKINDQINIKGIRQ